MYENYLINLKDFMRFVNFVYFNLPFESFLAAKLSKFHIEVNILK